MPAKYRTKPVEIEAIQVTDRNARDVAAWINANEAVARFDVESDGVVISTLEGDMRADVGDMVIRGVKGEFYPCKPDIFAATYDTWTGWEHWTG